MGRNTLIIDGDVLLYWASHRNTSSVQWDQEDGVNLHTYICDTKQALFDMLDRVDALQEKLNADGSMLALSDYRVNWRHDVMPEYKAGRRDALRPPGFRELLQETKRNFAYTWNESLEADDVVGILATKKGNENAIMVSIDKDFQTIPGRLYNPDRPDEGVREISLEEADKFHMMQALMGDRVDNYYGCPGVGPKTAEKILDCPQEDWWPAVVAAYENAGKTEEDALQQARVARILRSGEYEDGKVKLWTPSTAKAAEQS